MRRVWDKTILANGNGRFWMVKYRLYGTGTWLPTSAYSSRPVIPSVPTGSRDSPPLRIGVQGLPSHVAATVIDCIIK